jgi:23S rRNA (guanosine2251-2'-O)-methyltransferase
MAKPPKRPYSGKKDRRDPHPFPKKEVRRDDKKPAPRPAPPPQSRIRADLFGFHAVREAWKNPDRFVHALYATESALKEFENSILPPPPLQGGREGVGGEKLKRPHPAIVTKEDLDRAFPPGTVHQGIALSCQPLAEKSLMDLIIRAEAKKKSVIVVLDQVTDPHNIGAILRSACAFGADGIVMQSRHAPELSGILAKTASGAVEHIPVAYETNLSRALEKLQEHGYTVIGFDEHAERDLKNVPSFDRAVIVLGAEGDGMRRLVKEHCDMLVRLPTRPPIASLNVSNAAAVALYALTA